MKRTLDDNNVDRYAKYLHKLTKYTQFIVITHRRGTMAAADRLYGITMQEKGVSTLVSVDLLEDDLGKINLFFIVNRVLREQEAENGRRKKGIFLNDLYPV